MTTNDPGRRPAPPRRHETYAVGKETKRLKDELRRIEERFGKAMQQRDAVAAQLAASRADLDDAIKHNGRMARALEPFAVRGDQLSAYAGGQTVKIEVAHPSMTTTLFLTVEEFRAARSAMS